MGKNNPEEEARKAWINILESYFRDLEKKTAFLQKLAKEGHEDEAMTLCCCYIDGLANGLYGQETGSNKNFIRALKEYGENEIWGLIHPLQLVRNVLEATERSDKHKKLRRVIDKIIPILATIENRLYCDDEIIDRVKLELSQEETETLQKNLWRGLYANIVYDKIRCLAVHELGSSPLSFDKTTHKGEQVPPLYFYNLYPILGRILCEAKLRSLKTGKLYGRLDDSIKWSFVWPEQPEQKETH